MDEEQIIRKALVTGAGMNAQARYRRTHLGLWKTGLPRVRSDRLTPHQPVRDPRDMLEDDYLDPHFAKVRHG